MTYMLRTFALVAATAVAAAPAHAQDRFLTAAQYSVAIPIGDTHNYIANGSWSGGAWEWRWNNRPHTSIGILAGFNEFYSRDAGTFEFPAGAATGDFYRNLLMVPLLATGHWYFSGERDNPRWFVGGGGGLQFTQQIFQLGLQEVRRRDWGVVLVPEIGYAFLVMSDFGGIASVRYHLPSNAGNLFGNDDGRFQYVSISLGFGLR